VRYWWVNQNQTYRQEIGGGYLWSPKRKTNDQRNPFYESMREVAPGDVIFSFVDARIAALGIARSYCYESPKPTEFGSAGSYWGAIGWKVDVGFREISNRIRPKDHIGELRRTLPEKYSPLRPSGDGLQSVYLTAVSPAFAAIIFRLIGREASQVTDVGNAVSRAQQLSPAPEPTLEEWSTVWRLRFLTIEA
jgi:putative restriction endonuclease